MLIYRLSITTVINWLTSCSALRSTSMPIATFFAWPLNSTHQLVPASARQRLSERRTRRKLPCWRTNTC
jgi:hypothetical protein